jgi:signal transduction histidine kinase
MGMTELDMMGEGRPIAILLLEDSDLDVELVAECLAAAGIDNVTHRVITRDEFQAAIRDCAFDLILADYALPAFDGVAALALAREHCPSVPFVFVSGTLGEDVAVEALKNGATDYVTKQRLDRLPRTVMRALAEAKARTARREAEQALRELNATLEQRVIERTVALESSNRELKRQVAQREMAEAALRQAQRLEIVGQLTSGVAHDFNNLLTVILGNLQFLERASAPDAMRRRLETMKVAAERGAKLISQLLAFSRCQHLEPAPTNLNDILASMRSMLASTLGGSIRIDTSLDEALWSAMVDPTQIELVILNLVINARDAMEVGGTLTITTRNGRLGPPARAEDPSPGDYVIVEVSDTGSGMTEDVLERVFEPFFTTKGPGRGSGLGLAQVYGFAKQSGGGVSIDTRPGHGTTVSLYLPRCEVLARSEAVPAPPEKAPAQQRERPVILVVDDDDAVREVTARSLHDLGYETVETSSGQAMLDYLDRGGRVDLVLLDYAMPGMNGVDAARAARARRADIAILLVTGFLDTSVLGETGEDGAILKPYRVDELARKVEAALRGTRQARPIGHGGEAKRALSLAGEPPEGRSAGLLGRSSASPSSRDQAASR